jgi:polyisoprenyl-phosphate glycosyltransferase
VHMGRKRMAGRFIILTPVLDDWPSFSQLIHEIDRRYIADDVMFEVVAVDDGSSDPCDAAALPDLPQDSCIECVSVIRLALNLGHQRAIAVGLASVCERTDIDGVVVMDSDGEDRPDDLRALIAVWQTHPKHVVLARRAERSEAMAFKMGYLAYKVLFRVLTGRGISFGNFCLLPVSAARQLVHMPELWNNLPAAIIRSRLRYRAVQTKRGPRYAGRSKMNLSSLVVHGLSAMSVYTDVIFIRVLLAASCICGISVIAMILAVFLRLATRLVVPGWATTVVGDLVIILVQALILVVATTLMLLANRSTRQLIPITDTAAFVADRQTMMRRQPACETPVAV